MSFIAMRKTGLLALAFLCTTDALPQKIEQRQINPASEYTMVPKDLPSGHGFVPDYVDNFCPNGTHTIHVPSTYFYYPYQSDVIYEQVGDYFNISWINPALVVTHSGTDNKPGAVRNQSGDPFAQSEVLIAYNTAVDPQEGFFYQSANVGAGEPIAWSKGFYTKALRPVLTLKPACQGAGSQLAFNLMYCMSVDESAVPANFSLENSMKDLSNKASFGSAVALGHLWKTLDGAFNDGRAPHANSTGSCAEIDSYVKQLSADPNPSSTE